MRNLSLYFLAILVGALSGCCDIIDQPFSSLPPPPPGGGSDSVQKVLLIKYTGDRCGNCPKGNEEADKLHSLFGDKLVIVTMHTGKTFAEPDGRPEFDYDFRTPAGEELYNFLGKPGQPTGTINFVSVSGKRDIAYTGWGSVIQEQLPLKPQMNISITPKFSDDSVLTLKADVQYRQAGAGQRIAVYLIEDSIIYAQVDYRKRPDDVIPNYLHRHVFRGAIGGGGAFGESLPSTQAGEKVSKNYSFDFRGTGFNPRHCSVVVSVNDINTKNTLQVEEASIMK